MKRSCLLLVLLVICSCKRGIDHKYIESKLWMYDTGYNSGFRDQILFEQNFAVLKHDIIFREGKPMARVISCNTKLNEIIIKSLTSDSTGTFVNSEEFEK